MFLFYFDSDDSGNDSGSGKSVVMLTWLAVSLSLARGFKTLSLFVSVLACLHKQSESTELPITPHAFLRSNGYYYLRNSNIF